MGMTEILVVDDDIMTQNMLKSALAKAGYNPIVASNGMEAIKMATERLPSVIILDIMMPDIDGGEVADILRKNPKTQEIPIIFLSSLISKQEEKVGSRKDIVSFLSKPYNRELLLNEIKNYLMREKE